MIIVILKISRYTQTIHVGMIIVVLSVFPQIFYPCHSGLKKRKIARAIVIFVGVLIAMAGALTFEDLDVMNNYTGAASSFFFFGLFPTICAMQLLTGEEEWEWFRGDRRNRRASVKVDLGEATPVGGGVVAMIGGGGGHAVEEGEIDDELGSLFSPVGRAAGFWVYSFLFLVMMIFGFIWPEPILANNSWQKTTEFGWAGLGSLVSTVTGSSAPAGDTATPNTFLMADPDEIPAVVTSKMVFSPHAVPQQSPDSSSNPFTDFRNYPYNDDREGVVPTFTVYLQTVAAVAATGERGDSPAKDSDSWKKRNKSDAVWSQVVEWADVPREHLFSVMYAKVAELKVRCICFCVL